MKEHLGAPEEIRPYIESLLLTGVLDYWQSIRGDRLLASRANFDPMAIAKALPNVVLIDVQPDDRFVYRLAGSELESRYQMGSLAGKTPDETLGGDADRVLQPYRLVRDRRCLFYRNADQDWLGREPSFKGYQVLLIPFGDDDATITSILGTFDFRRG